MLFATYFQIVQQHYYMLLLLLLHWETHRVLNQMWANDEVKWNCCRVRLFVIPWTVAFQAPPSMELSRQEYWSRLPFPSPGDLPDPGIKPRSPALQADALPSELPGKPRENDDSC